MCLEAATRRPELVTDLVLLGAPLPDHEWSEDILEFSRREEEPEAEGLEPESIDLGAVSARTLVAVGELDKRDFHRIAERLARGIPDSRFALIEGAGHLPALERPGATAGVVREFLDI